MVSRKVLCERILQDSIEKYAIGVAPFNAIGYPAAFASEEDAARIYRINNYFKLIATTNKPVVVDEIPNEVLDFMGTEIFVMQHPTIAIALSYLGLLRNVPDDFYLCGCTLIHSYENKEKEFLTLRELIELFPKEVKK